MINNVKQLRSKTAKVNTYRVVGDKEVICMIIFKNLEWETEQVWSDEHCLTLQNIYCKYPYNTVHNAMSCGKLMEELAVADGAWDRQKATSPRGMSNAVEDNFCILHGMIDQEVYGEANAVEDNSDSSYESCRSRINKCSPHDSAHHHAHSHAHPHHQ